MSRTIVAMVVGAALLPGCGGDAQLVVDLVTDFVPGAELASVHTQLLGERGRMIEERTIPADGSADYVRGVRVAELASVTPGSYTVRVRLLGASGERLSERSVYVDVQGTHAVTVLVTRSCLDVTCPSAGGDPQLSECSGGRCVDPRCSPEEPQSCLPPACAADDECVAPVSCAVPRCVAGECLSVDEGACGVGRWCHPEEGCVDREERPDGGPPSDAGPDGGPCVPRDCATLGYECGDVVECGVSITCGACAAPDTCGGGGAANRCGNGDVTGPTVTITSGPDDPTRSTSASLTFTADDGPGVGVDRVECRLAGESFAPCASSFARSGLGEGTRTFEVRAWDREGNVGPIATWTWTIDRSGPDVVIAPIADPAPTNYNATASVPFSFSCTDLHTSCVLSTRTCEVDGDVVSCGALGGSVMIGATGPFAFGAHVLTVRIEDEAGNGATATRAFTVTRCAGDMQFPSRTSSGFARGGCCSGLVPSMWRDFGFGFWHPRGDGSCRPMSDFSSQPFETIWGSGSCTSGMTTQQWLQARGLPGCSSAAGRTACLGSEADARAYCGTDAPSGSLTPLHTRASEGWHPAPSAGCATGELSSSLLMERYGVHDVCFYTVDQASDRGSVTASDECKAGLTQYCRTNPVDSAVACVCATFDPYTDDGRR